MKIIKKVWVFLFLIFSSSLLADTFENAGEYNCYAGTLPDGHLNAYLEFIVSDNGKEIELLYDDEQDEGSAYFFDKSVRIYNRTDTSKYHNKNNGVTMILSQKNLDLEILNDNNNTVFFNVYRQISRDTQKFWNQGKVESSNTYSFKIECEEGSR